MKINNFSLINGFTILEIMIVIILLGVITGVALPNFQKIVRKSHERDAIVQLSAIHGANSIYKSRTGAYLSGSGSESFINSGLNINVIPNDMTYSYSSSTSTTFSTTASWDEAGSANDFTVRVNEDSIGASNPCCSAGSCPSLPAC